MDLITVLVVFPNVCRSGVLGGVRSWWWKMSGQGVSQYWVKVFDSVWSKWWPLFGKADGRCEARVVVDIVRSGWWTLCGLDGGQCQVKVVNSVR